MRVLAVSGSLRDLSLNTSLLRAAIEAAPEGVEVELWEGIGELPIYDQDLDDRADLPESVRRLREDWRSASSCSRSRRWRWARPRTGAGASHS